MGATIEQIAFYVLHWMVHFGWIGLCVGLIALLGKLLISKNAADQEYRLSLVCFGLLMLAIPVAGGLANSTAPRFHQEIASATFGESQPNGMNDPTTRNAVSSESETRVGTTKSNRTDRTSATSGNWLRFRNRIEALNSASRTNVKSDNTSPVSADYPSGMGDRPGLESSAFVLADQSGMRLIAILVAAGYVIGCLVFFLRLMLASWGCHRLTGDSERVQDRKIVAMAKRTACDLGLCIVPSLAICHRVTVPIVVGLFRPVILVPLAMVTQLPPEQIRAILAHEMSHVRRYDHVVVVVQRTVEAILFFHPVTWWLSRNLDYYRELCCDDLVISSGTAPLDYAESLYVVARSHLGQRVDSSLVSVAVDGARPSQLVMRISRVLGEVPRTTFNSSGNAITHLLSFLMIAGLAATQVLASGHSVVVGGEGTVAVVDDTSLSEHASDVPRFESSGLLVSDVSSEQLLPARTMMWVSIPDRSLLGQQFGKTQVARMLEEDSMQPFVQEFRGQFDRWIDEKNGRLGIRVEDIRQIQSGEICLAGVLPNQATRSSSDNERKSYGVVILVDVTSSQKQARHVLRKAESNLIAQGAKRVPMEKVHGAVVTKLRVGGNEKSNSKKRFVYHTIAGGWLLASDDEEVVREIVGRLAEIDDPRAYETLGEEKAFTAIAKKAAVVDVKSHIRWYMDPIGYMKFTQSRKGEEGEFHQGRDDWATVLTKLGFNAIKGLGGSISFATQDCEILHRSFVYAPRSQGEIQERFLGLLDFKNDSHLELGPPEFVLGNAATYFAGTWDMAKAFANVGHVVDSIVSDPGMFEAMMKGFKKDLGIDLEAVVDSFKDQIYVVTETVEHLGNPSEQILIAIRLEDDGEIALKAFENNLIGPAARIQIAGSDVLEITNEQLADVNLVELGDDPFDDPFHAKDNQIPAQNPKDFQLFDKKFVSVKGGFLLIASHRELMEKVLVSKVGKTLGNEADYQRIQSSLDKLVDSERISFRQFGRGDRTVKAYYDLMRENKLAGTDTVFLGRVLKHWFSSRPGVFGVDGSTLPKDFDLSVAPYLGPAGWALETTESGWLVTGIVLKKENSN